MIDTDKLDVSIEIDSRQIEEDKVNYPDHYIMNLPATADARDGLWRSHETDTRVKNNRPVTVTRNRVIQLYHQNGGNACRFFGLKESWKPGEPLLLTIDKIDPTKGYEDGNMMIILIRKNKAK